MHKTRIWLLPMPRGQQSQQQRNFEAMCRKFGVVYILARSVDDVYRGLTEHGFDHERYAA